MYEIESIFLNHAVYYTDLITHNGMASLSHKKSNLSNSLLPLSRLLTCLCLHHEGIQGEQKYGFIHS